MFARRVTLGEAVGTTGSSKILGSDATKCGFHEICAPSIIYLATWPASLWQSAQLAVDQNIAVDGAGNLIKLVKHAVLL